MPFFAVTCEVEEPNWIPFGSRHVLTGFLAARGPFTSAAEGERCLAEGRGSNERGWPWRSDRVIEASDQSQAVERATERSEQFAAIADRIGRQDVDPRSDIWWQKTD